MLVYCLAIALPYAAPEVLSREGFAQKLHVDLNVTQVAGAFELRHPCRPHRVLAVRHDCTPLFDCVLDGPARRFTIYASRRAHSWMSLSQACGPSGKRVYDLRHAWPWKASQVLRPGYGVPGKASRMSAEGRSRGSSNAEQGPLAGCDPRWCPAADAAWLPSQPLIFTAAG